MKKVISVFGVLIALTLVVAFILWLFFYRIAVVAGDDMYPALNPGAWVLIDQRAEPKRGDLVLFKNQEDKYQVRRLIALPGETVRFDKERPVIDGETAEHEVVRSYKEDGREFEILRERLKGCDYEIINDTMRRTTLTTTYKVPGGYYLLADNREHARDSRQYGPIAKDRVAGVAIKVLREGTGKGDKTGPASTGP